MATAVTPALRESYASGDTEELEYAALSLAADASRALLDAATATATATAADADVPRRRVVVACDVPDDVVRAADDGGPAAIRVGADVPLRRVAALHVDDEPREPAEDEEELSWYAPQELPDLVGDVDAGVGR